MAFDVHRVPAQHSAEPEDEPNGRSGAASGSMEPVPYQLVFLRPSLAIKLHLGTCYFEKGEQLQGTLMRHPINTSRKIVIRTAQGTFNINQEDVIDVSRTDSA